VACEAATRAEAFYCIECGAPEPLLDVTRHIEGVPVFAGTRYGEPIATVIQRFKYGRAAELAAPLASLALRGIDLLGIEASHVWVPVPLHPLRLAERGYNQSALLARELSRSVHGSVDARRLVRLRNTSQQVKRQRRERAQNVAEAFAVRTRRKHVPRSVVLVDDVVTTGSTLAACIRALQRAGDDVIGCLAVASVERPESA